MDYRHMPFLYCHRRNIYRYGAIILLVVVFAVGGFSPAAAAGPGGADTSRNLLERIGVAWYQAVTRAADAVGNKVEQLQEVVSDNIVSIADTPAAAFNNRHNLAAAGDSGVEPLPPAEETASAHTQDTNPSEEENEEENNAQPLSSAVTENNLTRKLTFLEGTLLAKIFELENRLKAVAGSLLPLPSSDGEGSVLAQVESRLDALQRMISLTNKIDNITNVTVNKISGLDDSDIPDGITASNYLPLAGGTLTGALTLSTLTATSTTATSTFAGGLAVETNGFVYDFNSNNVGIGTTTTRALLTLDTTDATKNLFRIATGTNQDVFVVTNDGHVGIGGDPGGSALDVTGRLAFTLPDSDLAAANFQVGESDTFFIDSLNNDIAFPSTSYNLGIGDATPSYRLDVNGDTRVTGLVDAAHFVATSSSATSTFAGGLAVETNGFVYDFSSGHVGIGTAAPQEDLEIEDDSGDGAIAAFYAGSGQLAGIKMSERVTGNFGIGLFHDGADNQMEIWDLTTDGALNGLRYRMTRDGNASYETGSLSIDNDGNKWSVAFGGNIGTTRVALGVLSNSSNANSNESEASQVLSGDTITTGSSGTHPVIATQILTAPTINSGTASVDTGTTLYIDGAPSGTATVGESAALYVNDGKSIFNGNVGIGTSSPVAQLALSNLLYVGGTGTSTIEDNLHVMDTLQVGTSSTYVTNDGISLGSSGITFSDGSVQTAASAGAGFGQAWELVDDPTTDFLRPTTTVGFVVSASSTVAGDFTVGGNLLPSVAPTEGTLTPTTVDSTGLVGEYTSIAIGSDNLPVISYYDSTNGDLKVVHCGNMSCTSGNTITTVDSTDDVGQYTSIDIKSDGNPIISYYDVTNGDLKVASCNNKSCSLGTTITTVDSTDNVGLFTSIATASSTNSVITYVDATSNNLEIAICGDADCSSGNTIRTLDSSGRINEQTSVTFSAQGAPVTSYYDQTFDRLHVVECSESDCSDGPGTNVVDQTGNPGQFSSIAIGNDDNPIVSYYEADSGDLKVADCNDSRCSGTNETITTVDSAGTVGKHTSIIIGTDNLPVVSYLDGSNLNIVHCGNNSCSSGNTITTVDSTDSVGQYTSIIIGPDDVPVVSYYDSTNADLKMVPCGNVSCSSTATEYSAGSSLGTSSSFFNEIYAANIFGKSTTLAAFDLAEEYFSTDSLEPGEIVSLEGETARDDDVKRTNAAYDDTLIGVVSTDPGILLADWEKDRSGMYPIALAGRVPVKVTTENGAIAPGDAITSSSKPGIGMKAADSGYIVGRALTGYESDDPDAIGTVTVFVNPGWWSPDSLFGRLNTALKAFVTEEAADTANGSASGANSSTTASSTEAESLPAASGAADFVAHVFDALKGKLIRWLADAANGIGSVVASVFTASEKICVDGECLTASDIKALKEGIGGGSGNDADADSGGDETGDTEPPTVTLIGNNPARIDIGATYGELGATVTDNVNNNLGYTRYLDGVEVDSISLDTSTSTTYEITYRAVDQAGNVGVATRTVIVGDGMATSESTADNAPQEDTTETDTSTSTPDTTAPTITLIGEGSVTIDQDTTYTDQGATATDDTDGDLTSAISVENPVDTTTVGVYTVRYSVADSAGNEAELTRTVEVAEPVVAESTDDTASSSPQS